MKPVFVMMVGLPGSGKSTRAREAAARLSAVLVSSDSIREELYGAESIQGDAKEVFRIFNRRIADALRKGRSCIADATNIAANSRMELLRQLKGIPCKKVCCFVDVPPEECKRRNALRSRVVEEEVIDHMSSALQPPRPQEGWDSVITLR